MSSRDPLVSAVLSVGVAGAQSRTLLLHEFWGSKPSSHVCTESVLTLQAFSSALMMDQSFLLHLSTRDGMPSLLLSSFNGLIFSFSISVLGIEYQASPVLGILSPADRYLSLSFYFIYYDCAWVECMHVCTVALMWKLDNVFVESLFLPPCYGFQGSSLSGETCVANICFYLLSYLTSYIHFLIILISSFCVSPGKSGSTSNTLLL